MPRTTPLVRRLARDLGVDLEQVRGTGRGGRITRADVEAAAAGRGKVAGGPGAAAGAGAATPEAPAPPPAPAPAQGPATIPLVHLTVAVDAEALLDLQDDLGREVNVPELVDRACGMLLGADPDLSMALGGDGLAVTHLDVDQLRAVVDPPAVAVLGLGAVVPEVVATEEGIEVRRRMRLTLSIDDRVVDGATGARFLGLLKAAVEQPLQILA